METVPLLIYVEDDIFGGSRCVRKDIAIERLVERGLPRDAAEYTVNVTIEKGYAIEHTSSDLPTSLKDYYLELSEKLWTRGKL